jgi:phosphatidylinositol alpha-mannosyltransferase
VSALDVLLVFRDARPSAGGLSVDLRDLANGLRGLGHRVEVATVRGREPQEDAYEFTDDVRVLELEPLPPRAFSLAHGIAPGIGRVIRERPNAVVHVFSSVPAYLHLAAIAAARRAGRPLLWTPMLHPSRRDLWRRYGAAGRAMRVFDEVVPRLGRVVDAVAVSTEAEADVFRRVGCKRIELLPPGVRGSEPVPDKQALAFRHRLGVGDKHLVLVVAGRPERRKGLPFGIESFRRLNGLLADTGLLLVGPRNGNALPDGVLALDRLSDEDLQSAFRAADVTFVPSSYEAFSRIVIEAWQQERPVVVTDGVALAEVVKKVGGRVVPYGDTRAAARELAELLRDPELAAGEGKRGRAVVEERYLVSTLVRNTAALYEEVCH